MAGGHASGAANLPLTPLPQSETKQFQGNYPFVPGYKPQK